MADMGITEIAATQQALIASLVMETLKQKSVLMPTITDYSHLVGPGAKSIDIPIRDQFTAESKAENTGLTAQAMTFTADTIALDRHEAVFVRLERIADLQANVNVKAEIIQEMAAELALKVDQEIIIELLLTSAAAPDHRLQYANTATDTLQQTDILEARRLLNMANVPMNDRYALVPPDQEKALLLLSDFVRADQYGSSQGLREGELGRVYGFTVIQHTGLTNPDAIFYHKSHVGMAKQKAPSFDSDKDLANIADEMLMDWIMGFEVLDSGVRGVKFNAAGT